MATEEEEFEFRARAEREAQKAQEPQRLSPLQRAGEMAKNAIRRQVEPLVGLGEAALNVGSGVVAGTAGLGAGAAGLILPGERGQGQNYMSRVQEGGTYQPQTETGKVIADVLNFLPRKLSEFSQWAGQGINDVTESPAAGAITQSALNFAPALLFRGRGATPEVAAKQQASVPLSQISQGTPKTFDQPFSNERTAAAGNLPVPMELTKGQATRDPMQLRREENLAQTDEGRAIRERHIDQNRQIIENLDKLKERAAPKSNTPEDVGKRVAAEKAKGDTRAIEGALSMAERRSSETVRDLYKKADASPERNMPVTPQPLIDWFTENGAAAASVPEINSVAQMLKKFGAVTFDEQGKAIANRDLTIGEMENVRKLAVKLQQPGTASGFFMGDLKRVIDWTTRDSGGDIYRSARKARQEHAMQFEEPQAIAKLLDSKSRTDRKVALEDVWGSTVLRGSISDLERVRGTLLKSTDRRVQDAGRKAWRDIAGNTVEYIKNEATKSVALDSAGNMNVSPAALKATIDRIGDKKLDLILGKSSADTLRNIAKVTQDVKTLPPYKGGSTTVTNFISMMDRFLNKIPIVGHTAVGGVKLLRDLNKSGQATSDVREAMRTPSPVKRGLNIGGKLRQSTVPLSAIPSLGRQPEQGQ